MSVLQILLGGFPFNYVSFYPLALVLQLVCLFYWKTLPIGDAGGARAVEAEMVEIGVSGPITISLVCRRAESHRRTSF